MRKAMYLMGVLDDSEVNWLAERGTVKTLERGAVLIQQGQPVESIFLLLDGKLSVFAGQKEVAALFSGEIVGRNLLRRFAPSFGNRDHGERSHLLAVPRAALQEKLDRDSKFAAHFYRAIAVFLADRLRTTTGRLGYGDARQDQAAAADGDELTDDLMESASLAAVRFDGLLKKLRVM